MKRNKVSIEEVKPEKYRITFAPPALPGTIAEVYINDLREDHVVNKDGTSVDIGHPVDEDARVDIYVT